MTIKKRYTLIAAVLSVLIAATACAAPAVSTGSAETDTKAVESIEDASEEETEEASADEEAAEEGEEAKDADASEAADKEDAEEAAAGKSADDSTKTVMTYYDYLKDGQKAPWWSEGMKAVGEAIGSLFGKKELEDEKVNTFKLTKEQTQIVKAISKKVVCDVDKKTMVITINVTDQDPLIAATMADSVQTRLQRFITDYRTRKARIDLEYNQKICAEAKERYDNARKRYAAFTDANQKIFLESVRSRQSELENELQLQQRAYSQIAAQLQLAEAKVQEETPAFTTLQPATVPILKDGPKRSRICLIFLFLAFLATTAYAFHKEGDLIPLFTADDDEPEPGVN